jgi:ABC-type transporter Mla maintaining outer membrane lipid asymmetry permease subunit MlaE
MRWDKMRRNIIIIGIVFFFIGLAINIIASTVLNEYGLDKFVVDLVGIIGFLYCCFSMAVIVIGIFLKDKKGLF